MALCIYIYNISVYKKTNHTKWRRRKKRASLMYEQKDPIKDEEAVFNAAYVKQTTLAL